MLTNDKMAVAAILEISLTESFNLVPKSSNQGKLQSMLSMTLWETLKKPVE